MSSAETFKPLSSDSRKKLRKKLNLATAAFTSIRDDLVVEQTLRQSAEERAMQYEAQLRANISRVEELERLLLRVTASHEEQRRTLNASLIEATTEGHHLTHTNQRLAYQNADLLRTIGVLKLALVDSSQTRFYTILAGIPGRVGRKYQDILLDLGTRFTASRRRRR